MRGFQVSALVALNLATGLAHQFLIATLLGAARVDVVFLAQAPFMVVSAVAASILSNLLTPRLSAPRATPDSIGLSSLLAPVIGVAVAAAGAILVPCVVFASVLFADRISTHPGFVTALLIFAAGSTGSAATSLLGAQFAANDRNALAERVQLVCSGFCLLCTWPLIDRWGIAGAALALGARPLLTAIVLGWIIRDSAFARPDPFSSEVARGLLYRAARLVPTHALQKFTPLLDRALLGYAEPGALAAYALAVQVTGAVLVGFDRSVTRDVLMRLGQLRQRDRRLDKRALIHRTAMIGWSVAAVFVCLTISAILDGPRVAGIALDAIPSLYALAIFGLLQIYFGAFAQLTAASLYASDQLKQLAALSMVALGTSVVVRLALFWPLGLIGFVAGVLLHPLISAGLFYRYTARGASHA